ncbi:MAG TPA: tetratricopeptide repeat protein [Armatimonadota bacterium]|nr:tetratricopeptide repeat protein [Armatimonadota bacterium]
MSDTFQVVDVAQNAIARVREDIVHAPRVLLLMATAVFVATRIVFSWLEGALSTGEAVILAAALFVSEAAAVRWVRDFQGLVFVLLLMLPVAIWAAVEVLIQVGKRESYRSTVHADMGRYREALKRDPRNAAAREMLGDAHMKLGRSASAIKHYRAALALEGESYRTRYKLERAERYARAH